MASNWFERSWQERAALMYEAQGLAPPASWVQGVGELRWADTVEEKDWRPTGKPNLGVCSVCRRALTLPGYADLGRHPRCRPIQR